MKEGEFADLIRNCRQVRAHFGPSGAWIEWDDTQLMPEELERLLLIRGVLNENMDGAGI